MMKKIISTLTIVALLCGVAVFPASANDAIIDIETEIENDFIPDDLQTDTGRNITREEFCVTLVNLYEYISETQAQLPTENPFTDTEDSDVLKAYQLGITQGFGDGLFKPDEELNVEQKAVMLYNTLLLLDPSIDNDVAQANEGSHFDYNDAESISAWAKEAIDYLYQHGILKDDKDENINPADTVSVDDANLHAQSALDHYNDLTELASVDKTQLLGCSAGDTRITMSDGSLKTIENMKPGDKVLGENGQIASVEDVITGYESLAIEITYGDDYNQIKVSREQPLMTHFGVIPAKYLRPGDKLMDKDGNRLEVRNIRLICYENNIYQLVFNRDEENNNLHFYEGNGILLGDYYIQNMRHYIER